ncbi:unnamed protein product [Rhodiola kirilowii]
MAKGHGGQYPEMQRCGKSCRLRWINYLRPDLKRASITTREEEIIIGLQASLGNRWSLIAGHLPGRTNNEIKNYWNSHSHRELGHKTSRLGNSMKKKDTDPCNHSQINWEHYTRNVMGK